MSEDVRYTEHNVTVQQIPPTQPRPKKRLSHAVKARPTTASSGAFQVIKRRIALRRKYR